MKILITGAAGYILILEDLVPDHVLMKRNLCNTQTRWII